MSFGFESIQARPPKSQMSPIFNNSFSEANYDPTQGGVGLDKDFSLPLRKIFNFYSKNFSGGLC